jgi:hypothetical protein
MEPPLQKYFELYPLQASAVASGIVAVLGGAWIYVTPGGSLPVALVTASFEFVAGTVGTTWFVRYRLRHRISPDGNPKPDST